MVIKEAVLTTVKYKTFTAAIEAFLSEYKGKPEYPRYACIGIAGPISGGEAKISNANWPQFNIDAAKAELGFAELFILNDFEVNGYGVLAMPETMYTKITDNPMIPGRPKILVGTGTGLGECLVTKGDGDAPYVVNPVEGGHADFAPRNKLEFELMEYVKYGVYAKIA